MSESSDLETNTTDYVINEDRARDVIFLAINEYKNPSSEFFKDKIQPEGKYVEFLREEGCDERYILNSLLLLSMMTFRVKTKVFFDRLHQNSEKFENNSWIFEPSEVVNRGEEATREACMEYVRPFGEQKAGLKGWYHNCKIMSQKYDSDIRNFFKAKENNSEKIWKALYIRPRAKTYEKEFYRFGPKLSSLYLQWIDRYGLYEFDDTNSSGLPVDFQLSRIALQTGIVEVIKPIIPHTLSYKILLPLFERLSEQTGFTLREISEALWLLGSEGCAKDLKIGQKDASCPIGCFCSGILVENKNGDGKFRAISENNQSFRKWEI